MDPNSYQAHQVIRNNINNAMTSLTGTRSSDAVLQSSSHKAVSCRRGELGDRNKFGEEPKMVCSTTSLNKRHHLFAQVSSISLTQSYVLLKDRWVWGAIILSNKSFFLRKHQGLSPVSNCNHVLDARLPLEWNPMKVGHIAVVYLVSIHSVSGANVIIIRKERNVKQVQDYRDSQKNRPKPRWYFQKLLSKKNSQIHQLMVHRQRRLLVVKNIRSSKIRVKVAPVYCLLNLYAVAIQERKLPLLAKNLASGWRDCDL